MATLLHFLRSLAVTLCAVSFLALCLMGVLLGGLMALNGSPIAFVSDALYMPLSEFLKVFGGGDRLEGMVAIALTLGVVASLLYGFSFYKSSQRLAWHLAVSGAGSGNREE